jgi:[1-hydroxy-2-(trimethylamino)ethyl]phosphonate dioxygenase
VNVLDEIHRIFARRGADAYFGESVSMQEHALQAAYFAQQEGAPTELVVAALLHDVGHLLDNIPDDIEDWIADAHHEELGSRWLASRFRPEVSEPVRLHVAAKRYLCATDPQYFETLSAASVHTLKLQGGSMAPHEIAAFETDPYFSQAVRVRRWDDQGKVARLSTPSLEDYDALIETLTTPANS